MARGNNVVRNTQTGGAGSFGVFETPVINTGNKFLTTQLPCIGDCVRFDDGRVFKFARSSGATSAGALVVSVPNVAAIAATYFGATSAVGSISGEGGAIGDTTIRISDDVTSVTENEYAGGYLNIIDGTGEGYQYRIKSNQATGTAGTGWTLEIYDGLKVALDTSDTSDSVGSLMNHPLDGVAESGTVATENFPAGKCVCAFTAANYYGWIQTWGPCVLQSGTDSIDVADNIMMADNSTGLVEVEGTGAIVDVIGYAYADAADTVWAPCYLKISP